MITTKQKCALGGLLAMSAAVWTPQLLARMNDDTSASVAPDGPDEAEMAAIDAEFDLMMAGDSGMDGFSDGPLQAPSAAMPTRADVDGSSGGSPLDPVAGGLVGPDALLASIAAALGQGSTFGGGTGPGVLRDSRVGRSWPGATPAQSEEDAANTSATLVFLRTHPLRGTFVTESRAFAIFGAHRLAPGDSLPGTAASVVSVGRSRVVVEEAGMSVEVELPPLQTSEARMSAQAAQRGAGGLQDRSAAQAGSPQGLGSSMPGGVAPQAGTAGSGSAGAMGGADGVDAIDLGGDLR